MISFRSTIDAMLFQISYQEKFINSPAIHKREEAAKYLEHVLPILRAWTKIHIKKFCNEPAIASNPAFLSSMRVDVLEKVRKHVDLELPKTYAKILKTTKK